MCALANMDQNGWKLGCLFIIWIAGLDADQDIRPIQLPALGRPFALVPKKVPEKIPVKVPVKVPANRGSGGGRGGSGGGSIGGSGGSSFEGRSSTDTRPRYNYISLYDSEGVKTGQCTIIDTHTGYSYRGRCNVDWKTILIICGVIAAVILACCCCFWCYVCCATCWQFCSKASEAEVEAEAESPIAEAESPKASEAEVEAEAESPIAEDDASDAQTAPVTSLSPPSYPSHDNGTGATDIFSGSSNPPTTIYDPPSYLVTNPTSAYPANVPFNPDTNPNYGSFNPEDTPKYGDNIGPSAPPPPPESGMDPAAYPSNGWTTHDPNGPPPPSYTAAMID